MKGLPLFLKDPSLAAELSTPEFTHLPHHDNYLHGNHSWHHKCNVIAEGTELPWDPAGCKCPLWSKGLTGTKEIWSWDFSRKIILEIYSCISILLDFKSSCCPGGACEYGQRAMTLLKWPRSSYTCKQTSVTSGCQPKDINL